MGFIPVAVSFVRELVPPLRVPSAIAAVSATLGLGGAIGLPLAAGVADFLDWRALFWASAILAVVVSIGVIATPKDPGSDARPRVDIVGALGLAIGLSSVLVALTSGPTHGWGNPRVWGAAMVGLAVLIGWTYLELRRSEPLCDLRVAAHRPVLLTNLVGFGIGFSMMMQIVAAPQFLQSPSGAGLDLFEAGLWMMPGSLAMVGFAPLSGQLIARAGPKAALVVGLTAVSLGQFLPLLLRDEPWQLMVASCILYGGVGIGYAAMPMIVMAGAPQGGAAASVGMNSLLRSIGSTCAAAVAATVVAQASDSGMPGRGFECCFQLGWVAALVGLAVVLVIPREVAGAASHTECDSVSEMQTIGMMNADGPPTGVGGRRVTNRLPQGVSRCELSCSTAPSCPQNFARLFASPTFQIPCQAPGRSECRSRPER